MIKLFMTHPCLPAGRPYSPLPEYSGGIIGNHFYSFKNVSTILNNSINEYRVKQKS